MSDEQLIKTPCVFGETGNFLLERELGRGGMGGVYMGRDKMLDRPVAVKVMLKEYGADREFVDKFKKEAQAAARLIHPNIAQIYSYGIAGGMPYIAMELVAGGSLDKLMEHAGGRIEIPRVMKICEQVAQALRCAADQGLVHGDVKPENILLDANGNAKLVDFGLAAMQKDTDEIWGTPYYIAPEKVKKEPVDYRADMYSLGGTIYHALTGSAPFEGEDAASVVRKRFEGDPRKPSELRPDISPQIDYLVMKMLASNPAARYPSFEALLNDFKKVMTTGLTSSQGEQPAMSSSKLPAGQTRRLKISRSPHATGRLATSRIDESAVPPAPAEEDGDEGGVGAKVALVVVGAVLLVGLVAGGLYWYTRHVEAAGREQQERQFAGHVEEARSSLRKTRDAAVRFSEEMTGFYKAAAEDCESYTVRFEKLLKSAKYDQALLDQLRPQPPQALLDARGGVVQNDSGDANAQPQAPAQAPAPAAVKPAADAPKAVKDVRELWAQAYACELNARKVCALLEALVKDVDADIASTGTGDEFRAKIIDAANGAAGRYESIVNSQEVANAKKAKGLITDRGRRTFEQAEKTVYAQEQQRRRDEEKKRREEEERSRVERIAREKAEKIAAETEAAREAFESVVNSGKVRQLDWKGAYRVMDAIEATYAESEIALKTQREKIECMELMQKAFVENMKGYVFAKPSKNPKENLKGATVRSVDMDKIVILRKNETRQVTIPWQTFYKSYPNSLNELINNFILKTGSVPGSKKLNKRERFEAIMGVGFIMRYICSENSANEAAAASATVFGDKLVTDAVKDYPEMLKKAQDFFPDIKFDDAINSANEDRVL